MSFQRLATWAKRIRPRVNSSIGQKFSKITAANRAGNVIASIEEAQDFQPNSRHTLKVFSWDKPDNKRNQFFHRTYLFELPDKGPQWVVKILLSVKTICR